MSTLQLEKKTRIKCETIYIVKVNEVVENTLINIKII